MQSIMPPDENPFERMELSLGISEKQQFKGNKTFPFPRSKSIKEFHCIFNQFRLIIFDFFSILILQYGWWQMLEISMIHNVNGTR